MHEKNALKNFKNGFIFNKNKILNLKLIKKHIIMKNLIKNKKYLNTIQP
jgi:hypothetical protein